MNTILYLTDNSLNELLANRCRGVLLCEANNIPIVSVSQKPLNFGTNICVGEIGRSWMSLYKQILTGLNAIETETVCIAEHDCLYTNEHLSYIPSDLNKFYYNHNHWIFQFDGKHKEYNGMFSYWPRRFALSQLICSVALLKQSTLEVVNLLNLGLQVEKGLRWYGEPGLVSDTFKEYVRRASQHASSGFPIQLQSFLRGYVEKFESVSFKTNLPNVDIRHGSNWTGPKRGKNRCFSIPYWGNLQDFVGVKNEN